MPSPSTDSEFEAISAPIGSIRSPDPEATVAHVSLLLNQLDAPDDTALDPVPESPESRLIQARLGFGSSLFTALRLKHAPSAAHSLRVALGCSSWAMAMGIRVPLLDEIEVAALLHDIGKIGVPDELLSRSEKLTASETTMLVSYRAMGLEIMRSFCASSSVLDIVRYAPRWYGPSDATGDSSSDANSGLIGESLPLGARILAIVDAFDSMTSDQTYRKSRTRAEALNVLCDHAGTQFDPNLVAHFCEMQKRNQGEIQADVARRWLHQITPLATSGNVETENASGSLVPSGGLGSNDSLAPLFLEKLIDSMRDGVVFVDRDLTIQFWNRGAQRLTGVAASEVHGQTWRPTLIGLKDEQGRPVPDDSCFVRQVMDSSVQLMRRLTVTSRSGRAIAIDLHIVPVAGSDGGTQGANLLMRDVSSELTLEERVQTLHVKASRDPLTGLANRAELDQTHQEFIDSHARREIPCSLIITDIDHFKRVNDTYGHQAGDDALKVFSKLLQESCRSGDLAARYGGEEFVLLCADCDLESAVTRAERLRREVEQLRLVSLGGKGLTASFGVTESLPGDTDESMLRRADEALLNAKEEGRNTVMVTSPPTASSEPAAERGWFGWSKPSVAKPVLDREIVTPVPLRVAVEKLHGFVAESDIQVTTIDKHRVVLRIEPGLTSIFRRESDRPVAFLIELQFTEEEPRDTVSGRVGQIATRLHITIRPRRSRDRRRDDVAARAQTLYMRLQSYLMATEVDGSEPATTPRATSLDGTWLSTTS